MRTKFSVGQTVYLASVTGQSVQRTTVTGVSLTSDKPGSGGPYDYNMSGFEVSYSVSFGGQFPEEALFDSADRAFRYIDEQRTPAASTDAAA